MPKRGAALAAVLTTVSLLCASPATAQLFATSKFAAYEGTDAVQTGRGGTKVAKDGVDFWTTGTPPRPYRILGILTDKRGSGLLSGNAVGSGGIAAKVKELGGDAVILSGEDSHVTGAFVSDGMVAVARKRTTQLVVVRYEQP